MSSVRTESMREFCPALCTAFCSLQVKQPQLSDEAAVRGGTWFSKCQSPELFISPHTSSDPSSECVMRLLLAHANWEVSFHQYFFSCQPLAFLWRLSLPAVGEWPKPGALWLGCKFSVSGSHLGNKLMVGRESCCSEGRWSRGVLVK